MTDRNFSDKVSIVPEKGIKQRINNTESNEAIVGQGKPPIIEAFNLQREKTYNNDIMKRKNNRECNMSSNYDVMTLEAYHSSLILQK